MKTHMWLAAMIYSMVNAVLFGLGAVPVLAIPALQEEVWTLFPIVIVSGFVLAVPIAWMIATRLRTRFA